MVAKSFTRLESFKSQSNIFVVQSLRNDHEARFFLRWVPVAISSIQNWSFIISLNLALTWSVVIGALDYFDSFDKVQLIFVHGLVHIVGLHKTFADKYWFPFLAFRVKRFHVRQHTLLAKQLQLFNKSPAI